MPVDRADPVGGPELVGGELEGGGTGQEAGDDETVSGVGTILLTALSLLCTIVQLLHLV